MLLNDTSIKSKVVWETFDPTGHFKITALGLNASTAPGAQLCFKLASPCDSLATLCNRKDGSCRWGSCGARRLRCRRLML